MRQRWCKWGGKRGQGREESKTRLEKKRGKREPKKNLKSVSGRPWDLKAAGWASSFSPAFPEASVSDSSWHKGRATGLNSAAATDPSSLTAGQRGTTAALLSISLTPFYSLIAPLNFPCTSKSSFSSSRGLVVVGHPLDGRNKRVLFPQSMHKPTFAFWQAPLRIRAFL